ncbi:MAG: DUF948 domain-containing protein [Candidatus Ancillula sp.]|jgi:hypothetical protein|nr:DUF948 domain-containing protein [Candidatus Ancillula sp.]
MNIPALIAAIAFLILMVGLTVALLVLTFEARKTLQKVNAELDKVAKITSLLVGPSKDVIAFLGKLNAYIKEPLDFVFSALGDFFNAFSSKGSKKRSGGSAKDTVGSVISILSVITPTVVEKIKKRRTAGNQDED